MRIRMFLAAILAAGLVPAAALADWQGLAGGPFHRSAVPDPIHADLYVRWKAPLGAPVQAEPLLIGEQLFAASVKGRIYALSQRNGQTLWSVDAQQEIRSALAYSGGTLFAVTFRGQILALDAASGRELWRAEAGERIIGAPVAADGSLFLALTNGEVIAFDAGTGGVRWRAAVNDLIHATPAYDGNRIFAFTVGGQVAAFDAASGQNLWSVTLRGTFGREQTGTVAGGKLLVSPNGNWRGGIFALDPATGAEVWRWIFWEEENHWSAPATADETVYVGNEGGIAALDLNSGKLRWYRETSRLWHVDRWYKPVMLMPVVAPNQLFAAGYWYHESGPPRLFVLDRGTGVVTKVLDVPGSFMSGLSARDGGLYYGSDDGHLYAYGTVKVTVNGEPVQFGALAPVIENGTALLPFRALSEALGAQVGWDPVGRVATVKRMWDKVELQIDGQFTRVNGKSVALDARPRIVNDRLMLPVRLIVESLGGTLKWNEEELLIEIEIGPAGPTV